jgi:DNA polymerase elongation subunit (family B)
MIFGVPVGAHTMYVEADLSDVGIVSQKPYDLIRKGSSVESFDSTTKFARASDNIDTNIQAVNRTPLSVNIQPYWGEKDTCNVVITRQDINLNTVVTPHAIFMGSIFGDNEEEIITRFKKVLLKVETKQFDLSGYRIFHFDIPWFLHKCHRYKIKPADIISTYNTKPWEMRVVDMSDDWKGKFAWSFSFDEMVYELGLDSPKDKMDGSEVHQKYWSGKLSEIVEYCEKDVRACIEASKVIYI